MRSLISKLLIISSLLMLLIWGCKPDDTPDPTNPDDVRAKYNGSWVCAENSKLFGQQTYSVNIGNDPNNSSQVLISNFYHFGYDAQDRAYAVVTSGTISVPNQAVCGHTIWGSGKLSGSKINWNYYVNDGADIDTVSAVYTKQ